MKNFWVSFCRRGKAKRGQVTCPRPLAYRWHSLSIRYWIQSPNMYLWWSTIYSIPPCNLLYLYMHLSQQISLVSQRKLRTIALEEVGSNASHVDLMARVKQQLPFPSSEGIPSAWMSFLPWTSFPTRSLDSLNQRGPVYHIFCCAHPAAQPFLLSCLLCRESPQLYAGSAANPAPWGFTAHGGEAGTTAHWL